MAPKILRWREHEVSADAGTRPVQGLEGGSTDAVTDSVSRNWRAAVESSLQRRGSLPGHG